MSWVIYDPDEWETTFESGSYGKYPGTNVDFGWGSCGQRRRTPEAIAKIKAERQLREEEEILRRAEEIKLRRLSAPPV